MSGFATDAVTATLTRPLRGTDLVETFTVLRGELGAPHRAAVPSGGRFSAPVGRRGNGKVCSRG